MSSNEASDSPNISIYLRALRSQLQPFRENLMAQASMSSALSDITEPEGEQIETVLQTWVCPDCGKPCFQVLRAACNCYSFVRPPAPGAATFGSAGGGGWHPGNSSQGGDPGAVTNLAGLRKQSLILNGLETFRGGLGLLPGTRCITVPQGPTKSDRAACVWLCPERHQGSERSNRTELHACGSIRFEGSCAAAIGD